LLGSGPSGLTASEIPDRISKQLSAISGQQVVIPAKAGIQDFALLNPLSKIPLIFMRTPYATISS
jgi:hypothetical protein